MIKKLANFCGAVLLATVFLECTDKAKPSYDKCVKFESKGEFDRAISACEAASKVSPTSPSGKAATDWLPALHAKLKAQKESEAEAVRKLAESQKVERDHLLASSSPDDWRQLIEKYPTSEEAKSARDQLEKVASICRDSLEWNMTKEILDVAANGKGILTVLDSVDESVRSKAFNWLARHNDEQAENLRGVKRDLEKHNAYPNEEPIRRNILTDINELILLRVKWAKLLRSFDGDLSAAAALQEQTTAVNTRVLHNSVKRQNDCFSALNVRIKQAASSSGSISLPSPASASVQGATVISPTMGEITGIVSTFAGSNQGTLDGLGTSASFTRPEGAASDGTNLFVADFGNNRIRKIVIATGEVTTFAGSK